MNDLRISWSGLEDYFFSISGNGLPELIIFISIVLVIFYGQHLWTSFKIRRWRKSIPLSVGGWGTRGKSGTERLKAAIFNALGYGVISKTTGCEAMFIYTPPFGDPKEMFLFRPYDKATIWEQADLLKLSKDLGAEVFLWECMALTPSYVRILQQDWMKDDLATLTNTFPDHEDLQGPAGYNIPEVMNEFVTSGRQVVTTEESMLPILTEAAQKKGAEMKGVGWLEAGLIPEELLERFPYDEHPFNVALVTAMASELGFSPDRSIKEMADRVVADLGVLKTYPQAKVQGRKLEFIMGMSANERFGCLGNWTRMGLDSDENSSENGIWVSTVVNNRADRIPRSEVFARILVHDIQADRHVLIGTNLSGLTSYLETEREGYNAKVWSSSQDNDPKADLTILGNEAKKLRVPLDLDALKQRLAHLFSDAPDLSQDLNRSNSLDAVDGLLSSLASKGGFDNWGQLEWARLFFEQFKKYESFREPLSQGRSVPREKIQSWLDQIFFSKLVPLDDSDANGDEVNALVLSASPPGMVNRIMGMQNIKGTGLDFVYRWQAWEQVHKWCGELLDGDEAKFSSALEGLVSWQEFGLLDREFLPEVTEQARHLAHAQSETVQAMLNRIEARHHSVVQAQTADREKSLDKELGFKDRCLNWIEPLVDSGDAVRRRKKADQIYSDLASGRIAMDVATVELRKLTKRQKGGWLSKEL